MKITYNNYDFPITERDGVKYINFNYFMLVHRNFLTCNTLSSDAKKLPVGTWFKEPNKKKSTAVDYYINGEGLIDFIERAISIPYYEKKSVLEQLIETGMVERGRIILAKRLEIQMLSDLRIFFKQFDKQVRSQVSCGAYLIDYVIDTYAIEYDENGYYNYDKQREAERTLFINKSGYSTIRITDKCSSAENIAIILKAMGVRI